MSDIPDFLNERLCDRNGNPIDFKTWGELSSNRAYKRVAEDTVGELWVSTVWLGLDHGIPMYDRAPVIFETMVFPKGSWADIDCYRYATEEEAIIGHEAVVAELRAELE